jgi:GNAT superfamily N-acetyltransferase
MELYAIQQTDSALLRDVLLRMYADTPTAFGESLETAQARPDAEWEGFVQMLTSPYMVGLAARQEGRVVGFVAGVLGKMRADGSFDHSQTETVIVGRMWVEPETRGQGAAKMLMDALADWARGKGAKQLELGVSENGERAIRFYQREGFVFNGYKSPNPAYPQVQLLEMIRDL